LLALGIRASFGADRDGGDGGVRLGGGALCAARLRLPRLCVGMPGGFSLPAGTLQILFVGWRRGLGANRLWLRGR